MARYDWKERPIDGPMARVIRVVRGSGKVRYRVEVYFGVTHANWESVEDWRVWCERKSFRAAQKIAARLDLRRRRQAVACEEVVGHDD